MDNSKKEIICKRIKKTASNLALNNMEAYVVDSSKDALETVRNLIKKGDTIATGGSVTLKETGIYNLITNGDYEYVDRAVLSPDECLVKTCTADIFLCSSNAVTENGELYNVDGNSNRISAIAYGPKSVIIVVGYNKIVANLDEAVLRVKKTAAPDNTVRLNMNTYCHKNGECISILKDNSTMCDGCNSKDRICCNYLISAKQRNKNRIKVIIVCEELGY